jgi:hypothetical protein
LLFVEFLFGISSINNGTTHIPCILMQQTATLATQPNNSAKQIQALNICFLCICLIVIKLSDPINLSD